MKGIKNLLTWMEEREEYANERSRTAKTQKKRVCVKEREKWRSEQMASLALICGELLPEALVNGSSKMWGWR